MRWKPSVRSLLRIIRANQRAFLTGGGGVPAAWGTMRRRAFRPCLLGTSEGA